MGDSFYLEKQYIDAMVEHALAEAPNECCGILAGKEGRVASFYRCTNAEHSPSRYSILPSELVTIYREIRENHWELLAIYHSHTHTGASPSPTDLKSAVLTEPVYLIVSLREAAQPVVKGFRIVGGEASEVQIKVGLP